MSRFSSVTPNLIVMTLPASTAFYRDVLGFVVKQTVPDEAPFVFVWLERDGVPVFLNAAHAVAEDYPDAASRPAGGTATMFFIVTDVDGAARRRGPARAGGDAAQDAVLRHARVRRHRSGRAHPDVCGKGGGRETLIPNDAPAAPASHRDHLPRSR